MVTELRLNTRYITGSKGKESFALADEIVSLILRAWDNNQIPIIHSAPNTGKTTANKYISDRLQELTNKTGILALPTRTINRNKINPLTFHSNKEGQDKLHYIEEITASLSGEELKKASLQGVYDSVSNVINSTGEQNDFFVATDEVGQLYQSIGFRAKAMRSLLNFSYIYGMSGTPKMLEYSDRFLVIKLIQDESVKAKAGILNLIEHDCFKAKTLVNGIVSKHIDGDLTTIRINSYNSIRSNIRYVREKYPNLKVAALFSYEEQTEDNKKELIRDYYGLNQMLTKDEANRLKYLDIDSSIDVLFTTQVSDEGNDFKLQQRDSKDRLMRYHIVNPKNPVIDKDTEKVVTHFTSMTEPEVVAQIMARERDGNQITHIYGNFSNQLIPDYYASIKLKEAENPTDVEYMAHLNELFTGRAKINREDWITEVEQYNIKVVNQKAPVLKTIYDTSLRHGAVRQYLCLLDGYDYTNDGSESYTEVMTNYSRTGWVEDCTADVILDSESEVYDKVSDISKYERKAAKLDIPFEYFINDTGYYFNRLLNLIEIYKYKESNTDVVSQTLDTLLNLEDVKIDLTQFRDTGETQFNYIKTLATLLYDSNRKWKRNSIKLTYDFEATYPQYYIDNKENEAKRQQALVDERFWSVRGGESVRLEHEKRMKR